MNCSASSCPRGIQTEGRWAGVSRADDPQWYAHTGALHSATQLTARSSGRKRIQTLAIALRLPDRLSDAGQRYFNLAVNMNFVQGRRTQYVVAACLYSACRMAKTSHMLIDFSDLLEVSIPHSSTRLTGADSMHPRSTSSSSDRPTSSSSKLSLSSSRPSTLPSTSPASPPSSSSVTRRRRSHRTPLASSLEWPETGCTSVDDPPESVERASSSPRG